MFKFSLLAVFAVAMYVVELSLDNNFHTVIGGELYRSAQPSAADMDKYAYKYNIRSVINLRGEHVGDKWYDDEVTEAKLLGIRHIDFRMSAKNKLTDDQYAQLMQIMKDAPKPILIHCRSGADRTGLASAVYLAGIKHAGEMASEMQLSPIYGHIPLWFIKQYAMDEMFESLETSFGYTDS